VIRTACIEDRERLKGRLICGTRKLERISVSRLKEYQYFVNVIDVTRNNKQSVPLDIKNSLLFSIQFYKDNNLPFPFE
jgi:hypothetical protein